MSLVVLGLAGIACSWLFLSHLYNAFLLYRINAREQRAYEARLRREAEYAKLPAEVGPGYESRDDCMARLAEERGAPRA